jgi:phage shock protein PspC (stress-responsive transcriptional regulator)
VVSGLPESMDMPSSFLNIDGALIPVFIVVTMFFMGWGKLAVEPIE